MKHESGKVTTCFVILSVGF